MASGSGVKLANCKSALNPQWFTLLTLYGRGPGVSLTLCCFVVYSAWRFVLCLTLCYFVLVFFSPFSIAIISLGEEKANLSAFHTFVQFVLVWLCQFPLRLGVCLSVLRFYGPVNPMGSCRARSVYLTTYLLGRLNPLSG